MYVHQHNRFVALLFFGNYFYGICAVALSIEASLQQGYPLNDVLFYTLLFLATVLYYTVAYMHERHHSNSNKRSAWYQRNRGFVKRSQLVFSILFAVCALLYTIRMLALLGSIPLYHWMLIVVFPLVASMYYGLLGRFNLRDVGWLKPFVIGFTWAGMATVYPVLAYCAEQRQLFEPHLINALLFLKNFMFVSVLCILFDIKDYAADHNQQLKTFVVEIGLRRTIFYIIIPLCILGLGTFLTYGLTHSFSAMKILLNTIPFLALLAVAYSLHRRRSILYYLIIIDGLMLVKAICGIVAMRYF